MLLSLSRATRVSACRLYRRSRTAPFQDGVSRVPGVAVRLRRARQLVARLVLSSCARPRAGGASRQLATSRESAAALGYRFASMYSRSKRRSSALSTGSHGSSPSSALGSSSSAEESSIGSGSARAHPCSQSLAARSPAITAASNESSGSICSESPVALAHVGASEVTLPRRTGPGAAHPDLQQIHGAYPACDLLPAMLVRVAPDIAAER